MSGGKNNSMVFIHQLNRGRGLAVSSKSIVGPGNLERDERGSIAIRGPKERMLVISDSEVPRGPWPQALVLVQGSVGIGMELHLPED